MKWFRTVAAIAWAALLAGCGEDDKRSMDADSALTGGKFTYLVEDCTLVRMGKGLADFPEDAVEGQVDGISFHHILDTFCSAGQEGALELRPVIDANSITINEIFKGEIVRCTCPIPVSGELTGLEPGVYSLTFTYAVEREGVIEEPEVLYETSVAVGYQVEPFSVLEADITLAEVDDGAAVEMRIGDRLAVALPGNPSTGYAWEVEALDGNVLRLAGDPDFRPDSDAIGAGGRVVLRFEAVGAGRTGLRLAYRRPWERDVEPLSVFTATIEVK